MPYLLIGLLASLPLGLAAAALWLNRVPLIDPPGLGIRLRTYLTTNVAETRPDHPFPELRERRFSMPAPELYAGVLEAARSLGWRLVREDREALRLEAVVETPLLRFRDDVQIDVRPAGAQEARLHLRSASRVGRGDFGANTRHVRDLYRALE